MNDRAPTPLPPRSLLPTIHIPPTCPTQCRRLLPNRLPLPRPRPRNTNHQYLHSSSRNSSSRNSSSSSHSHHHILLHTNNTPCNRLRTHTPHRLRPRDNGSPPVHLHRPIRLGPSTRLLPISQAPAAMEMSTEPPPTHLLLPPRNRLTRRTTSSHHRKHLSTHHSPIRRSKWHGSLRQPLPRLRCSVRSSKVLDHHSQTA